MALCYNQPHFAQNLLSEYKKCSPSFAIDLYDDHWTLNKGPNKFLYTQPVSVSAAAFCYVLMFSQGLLDEVRALRIPVDFSHDDVVAALMSHTIARSDHMDPHIQAIPMDTTLFCFDMQIHLEILLKGVGFSGKSNNTGQFIQFSTCSLFLTEISIYNNKIKRIVDEVISPLPLGENINHGEIRLQSDALIARDPSTVCTWQSLINQQTKMSEAFKEVMTRMAIIRHSRDSLISCSSVIPHPLPPIKGAT